jgi:hypothetical protein
MKKPVGPLGWTAEEHREYARTKKLPEREVEAPDSPPGLTLTSLPPPEYLRGFLHALGSQRRPRGAPSKEDERLLRVAECLRDAGWRTEDARILYCERVGGQRDTASRQFSKGLKSLITIWGSDYRK